MSNQIEVSQVVAMLGAAYPNFLATKETVSVYYELLKDLPADLLKAASLKCCAENGRKFAPSVGEIRGTASEINAMASGVPSTLEAWNEVCNAPRSGEYRRATDEKTEEGFYIIEVKQFDWSHHLVKKVAELLGWPNFPNPENESTDRAHFFRMYEAEINKAMEYDVQLPEVERYIEDKRQASAIKQLTGRLTK
ncbi:MAG: replicative helicase loader/inhibitor [Candidatus Obscuribacterales bacterium]|jgi:hypothetical protein